MRCNCVGSKNVYEILQDFAFCSKARKAGATSDWLESSFQKRFSTLLLWGEPRQDRSGTKRLRKVGSSR